MPWNSGTSLIACAICGTSTQVENPRITTSATACTGSISASGPKSRSLFNRIEHHSRHIGDGEKIQLQQGALHPGRVGADVDLDIVNAHLLPAFPFQLGEEKPHHVVGQGDQFEDANDSLDRIPRIADGPDDLATRAGEKITG